MYFKSIAMVTLDNYEEYLMMQADGELGAQELDALQAFLDAHPELAAEAGAWQDLKLVPDRTIRFEAQESLLKPERKVIAFRPWLVAVPAAAALLLTVFLVQRPEAPQPDRQLAMKTAPVDVTLENPIVAPASRPVAAVPVTNPRLPQKDQPVPQRRPSPARVPVRTVESIAALDLSRPAGLSAEPMRVAQPEYLNVAPAPSGAYLASAAAASRVQLAAENLEALNVLKAGIDERIEQIGRVAKTIRDTQIEVKIGGNALHINF